MKPANDESCAGGLGTRAGIRVGERARGAWREPDEERLRRSGRGGGVEGF